MQNRAACFWATPCGRGCSIRANYQSTTVHLPPALATGNLDVVTGAMAREITVDASGQASGVAFIDKATGLEHQALGRAVVLAAGSCETVRLLLNSKSNRHSERSRPTPAAWSASISWTPSAASWSRPYPPARGPAPAQRGRRGGEHVYSPWWLYKEQLAGKLGFARGYHVEIGTGRGMPGGYEPYLPSSGGRLTYGPSSSATPGDITATLFP